MPILICPVYDLGTFMDMRRSSVQLVTAGALFWQLRLVETSTRIGIASPGMYKGCSQFSILGSAWLYFTEAWHSCCVTSRACANAGRAGSRPWVISSWGPRLEICGHSSVEMATAHHWCVDARIQVWAFQFFCTRELHSHQTRHRSRAWPARGAIRRRTCWPRWQSWRKCGCGWASEIY